MLALHKVFVNHFPGVPSTNVFQHWEYEASLDVPANGCRPDISFRIKSHTIKDMKGGKPAPLDPRDPFGVRKMYVCLIPQMSVRAHTSSKIHNLRHNKTGNPVRTGNRTPRNLLVNNGDQV